jgi:hypothetical protein
LYQGTASAVPKTAARSAFHGSVALRARDWHADATEAPALSVISAMPVIRPKWALAKLIQLDTLPCTAMMGCEP